jgi:hypothetical protein
VYSSVVKLAGLRHLPTSICANTREGRRYANDLGILYGTLITTCILSTDAQWPKRLLTLCSSHRDRRYNVANRHLTPTAAHMRNLQS